ncbi:hypothetical protein WEI85_32525 [Actinomycetes bacterium KLBMP 9797]
MLRRIWSDLARARNLEIYITALLAVGLGLLGAFDVVDDRAVAATTLATLALLALSNLAGRHQQDDLRASIGALTTAVHQAIHTDVPVDRVLAVKAPALDEDLRAATDIRLVGVTLSRTVRDMVGPLDRRLRAGAVVRVIVIDPDSAAPLEAFARTLGVTSPDFYRPRVDSTIEILSALALLPGTAGRIEVRLLPFVPTFGMYLVDPGTADGRIYVELYQHRSLEPNPCFGLRAERDGHWYGFFVNQFDTLWESARPVPLALPPAPAAP